VSNRDERKLDKLDTEDKGDSALALKLVAILLLVFICIYLIMQIPHEKDDKNRVIRNVIILDKE
jgi:hypothetical protein